MYIALRTCITNLEMNATADLISIGLVAETGETFYAERQTYDSEDIDDRVQETVVDQLKLHGPVDNVLNLSGMRTKDSDKRIRERLIRWLRQFSHPNGRIPMVVQNPIDWVYFIKFLGNEAMLPDNIFEEPLVIQSFMFGKGLMPYYNPAEMLNEYQIFSDIDKSLDALHEDFISTALYDAVLIKFSFDYVRIITTPQPQPTEEIVETPDDVDIPAQEDAREDQEYSDYLEERLEEEYNSEDECTPEPQED